MEAAVDLFQDEWAGQDWFPAEVQALKLPEDITVSAWAEKYRILPVKLSPEPGAWQNAKAPYTVEIMDSFKDPLVERITIMAAVQSSKSEPVYNMLAYAIDQDPAPVLIVMPTDKAIKKVSQRIKLMIEDSPQLIRHITGNPDHIKQKEIELKNMNLWFATAGSSADLRNVSARYVYLDETDDYPPATGDQGAPTEMAEARATTFWNRIIIESCTATTPEGHINRQLERSDNAKYWVPCPYCKKYQVLDFWQIKHKGSVKGEWPRDKRDPDYIKQERAACYECEHCQAEIDDKDKPWMLKLGTWIPEGHHIEPDGTVEIPRPRNPHRGFWWNALYSLWRTFSEIAAKFFDSRHDKEKLQVFWNLWLALPWQQIITTTSEEEVLEARVGLGPQIVPAEAVGLTCAVDVQKLGFWFGVRAWARDYTSWLIHYGLLATEEDLEEILFETLYPVEQEEEADGDPGQMGIFRAVMDTGGGLQGTDMSLTEQTYWFIRRNMGRGLDLWGTKGSSTPLPSKVRIGKPIDKTPTGKPIPGGLRLLMLDTHKLKDIFHYRLEKARKGEIQGAFLHGPPDDWNELEFGEYGLDYARQILAEKKQLNKRGLEEWVQIRRDNHLLDIEQMLVITADPEWPRGGIHLVGRRRDRKPGTRKTLGRGFVQKTSKWLRR